MGLVIVLYFFLGPWYAQTVFHQDLHDPVNLAAWVSIGTWFIASTLGDRITDAIKAKK